MWHWLYLYSNNTFNVFPRFNFSFVLAWPLLNPNERRSFQKHLMLIRSWSNVCKLLLHYCNNLILANAWVQYCEKVVKSRSNVPHGVFRNMNVAESSRVGLHEYRIFSSFKEHTVMFEYFVTTYDFELNCSPQCGTYMTQVPKSTGLSFMFGLLDFCFSKAAKLYTI